MKDPRRRNGHPEVELLPHITRAPNSVEMLRFFKEKQEEYPFLVMTRLRKAEGRPDPKVYDAATPDHFVSVPHAPTSYNLTWMFETAAAAERFCAYCDERRWWCRKRVA